MSEWRSWEPVADPNLGLGHNSDPHEKNGTSEKAKAKAKAFYEHWPEPSQRNPR
jgi:hypothetical protein